MTNYQTGHDAEQTAADYLAANGFVVEALNWKNRLCEIDIIARKNKTIHFIEVKSRKTSSQGFGTDYITPKKLQQMSFAAEYWVAENRWKGDVELSVISIDAGVITLIEKLS